VDWIDHTLAEGRQWQEVSSARQFQLNVIDHALAERRQMNNMERSAGQCKVNWIDYKLSEDTTKKEIPDPAVRNAS
jgi:hypothetical protein